MKESVIDDVVTTLEIILPDPRGDFTIAPLMKIVANFDHCPESLLEILSMLKHMSPNRLNRFITAAQSVSKLLVNGNLLTFLRRFNSRDSVGSKVDDVIKAVFLHSPEPPVSA